MENTQNIRFTNSYYIEQMEQLQSELRAVKTRYEKLLTNADSEHRRRLSDERDRHQAVCIALRNERNARRDALRRQEVQVVAEYAAWREQREQALLRAATALREAEEKAEVE